MNKGIVEIKDTTLNETFQTEVTIYMYFRSFENLLLEKHWRDNSKNHSVGNI